MSEDQNEQQSTPPSDRYTQFAAAIVLAVKWGIEREAIVARVRVLEAEGKGLEDLTAFLGGLVDEAKGKAHAVQAPAA